MRVLVCPTAFKESLGAAVVARAMRAGVLRALPGADVSRMPLSDGGPGLLDALSFRRAGRVERATVRGPLGDEVEARILLEPDLAGANAPTGVPGTAAVEAADACGLHLVPEAARDPLRTDTRGVGDLVLACAALGVRSLTLGLGGSGTVDGGTGMARALGYRFLDASGRELEAGGGALLRLARIEPPAAEASSDDLLPELTVTALADVRSPLLGPDGAARRFGPQKGADAGDVECLEAGLSRLAERFEMDLGVDVRHLEGAGAAGGLGAGCVAFLEARLVQGADWVLERLGFDAALARARLVVTGEGAWDATSRLGKVTVEVLERARRAGVPAILACGRIRGEPPSGVVAVDGSGRWLDEAALADLTASAVGDRAV